VSQQRDERQCNCKTMHYLSLLIQSVRVCVGLSCGTVVGLQGARISTVSMPRLVQVHVCICAICTSILGLIRWCCPVKAATHTGELVG